MLVFKSSNGSPLHISLSFAWLLEPFHQILQAQIVTTFSETVTFWPNLTLARGRYKFCQLLVAHGPDAVGVSHGDFNYPGSTTIWASFRPRRIFAVFCDGSLSIAFHAKHFFYHVSSSPSGGRSLNGQSKKQKSSSQASHSFCKISQAQSRSSMLISTV